MSKTFGNSSWLSWLDDEGGACAHDSRAVYATTITDVDISALPAEKVAMKK